MYLLDENFYPSFLSRDGTDLLTDRANVVNIWGVGRERRKHNKKRREEEGTRRRRRKNSNLHRSGTRLLEGHKKDFANSVNLSLYPSKSHDKHPRAGISLVTGGGGEDEGISICINWNVAH